MTQDCSAGAACCPIVEWSFPAWKVQARSLLPRPATCCPCIEAAAGREQSCCTQTVSFRGDAGFSLLPAAAQDVAFACAEETGARASLMHQARGASKTSFCQMHLWALHVLSKFCKALILLAPAQEMTMGTGGCTRAAVPSGWCCSRGQVWPSRLSPSSGFLEQD